MQKDMRSDSSLRIFKKRELFMAIGSVIALLIFIIHLPVIQDKCQVTVKEEDIDYILLDTFDERTKRVDDELSKKEIVDYINGLGRLRVHHDGDPVIGTPEYYIRIFLYDGSKIELEDNGRIAVSDENSRKWYDSYEDFRKIFQELYTE